MNLPPYGDKYRKLAGNIVTLQPSAQDSPNMTIKVSAGGFWTATNGLFKYIEYVGGSSPIITAPTSNAKWVVVAITSTGQLINIDGTSSSSPILPTISRFYYPLAFIYVTSDTTKLTNDQIFDARSIFCNSVRSHLDLADNSTVGCHSISSIVGLQDALDAKVASVNLTSILATKSDVAGTINTIFELNKDHFGDPNTDCYFGIERGASINVYIKWNESDEEWEYTNDGTTWTKLSLSYLNDGTQEINFKVVEAATEPIISQDNASIIWKDTDDSNRIYLVFRRGSGDQLKVELV